VTPSSRFVEAECTRRISRVLAPGQSYTVSYDPAQVAGVQCVTLLHTFDGGVTWSSDVTHHADTGAIEWIVPNTIAERVQVAVVEVIDDSSPEGVIGVLGLSDPFSIQGALGVDPTPHALELEPVRPTPSAGRVLVSFGLPHAAKVDLAVFDPQGRRLVTLVEDVCEAGRQVRQWRGNDQDGRAVMAGVYFVRLAAEHRVLMRRIIWSR
jgi:hypothetical protein